MHRTVPLVAALAAVTSIAAGCSSSAKAGGNTGGPADPASVTVGVSFDLLNATRTAEKNAIQQAAAAAGYKVVFDVADSDAQKQASQIQDLIETQHVNAIIAIAQDGRQISASISLAKARNVPFVTIDRSVADQSDIAFQITGNPTADGKLAATQFIDQATKTPLKVLELVGGLTDQNAIGRRDGFNQALSGAANVSIVSQVPTDWDPTQALNGTSNALQKDPSINAIFVPSDFLLPSVESALTSAGRLAPIGDPKHVFIVTIDGDQNGCKAISDKDIDADVATLVGEFGKQAIAAVTSSVAGKTVDPKTVTIPGLTLTQADYSTTSSQVWGCAS
jgi:ABC-type sugar transport system substrate-binding protein